MGTLDAIQQLSDGALHQLGDDLLPRLETRYRRLRTHGLNTRGESIKGQPDSYVGNTAATANIAVCYTVQRASWWNKVADDVKAAVKSSPMAIEVVVVIPRDVDRDGPSAKVIDWLKDAQATAGNATVRVIDGREISRLLDTVHQDLRYKHLGIPYSRLYGASIHAGCQSASALTLAAIQLSGRYDPGRYSSRKADQELYRLWQAASDQADRNIPARLIPLVNDSGVGKTSLVCEFTRSLGTVLPVLLLQSRDLAFATEDSLVASVIHAIQGFLDPSVRVVEEVAICSHLSRSVPLTIVLDGLDETHNPDGVRRAINYWLRSKICKVSILIVTSRPEFWRICVDPSWVQWMPNLRTFDRSPVRVADLAQVDKTEAFDGVRLPDRFSEEELETAWLRTGRPRAELFSLPAEACEELRHPFTLRVFIDIQRQTGTLPRMTTRTKLLECWLNQRLNIEALPIERITRSHFQQALRTVAKQIVDSRTGSVSVDKLTAVPRFDPAHPPGPVIQRLIEASILETLPGQPDHIRFTIEAVQDFYTGESDVDEIRRDPVEMAENLAALTFTSASPRLARIGYALVGQDVRHDFILRLNEADPRKAAVVLRTSPYSYAAETRAKIASGIGSKIAERYRVRAAMAITLLGELNCPEACDILAKELLPPANLHRHLKAVGAMAFIKLSYTPAAAFVYQWTWFGIRNDRNDNGGFYFRELLAPLRAATPEFQNALAAQALQHLLGDTVTNKHPQAVHAQAVTVLAYLADGRLVDHLATRLSQNGRLENYEHHALVALGSEAAAKLFSESAKFVGERLSLLPNNHENIKARNALLFPILVKFSDVRYLITQAFVSQLDLLIKDDNPEVSIIATDLAKRVHVPSLLHSTAVAEATGLRNSFVLAECNERSCVSADLWLTSWRQSVEIPLRLKLLKLAPSYPNAEIEEILIDCLDSPELCGLAAKRLGEYGAIRSARRLREVFTDKNENTSDDLHNKSEVVHALGSLRDDSAVELLEKIATDVDSDNWLVEQAIGSLGWIGHFEAEQALGRLLQSNKGEDFDNSVYEALLCCGSLEAVAQVVRRAEARQDGPLWLCDRMSHIIWLRGSYRGEYFTHIQCSELVEYLDKHASPGSPKQNWDLGCAFEHIDGPEVRGLLRKWAGRRGTSEDPLARESDQRKLSDLCYWELQCRGDVSAIGYFLDEQTDLWDDVYVTSTARQLRSFPAASVAEELRQRLKRAATTSETKRILALLGRFGERFDAELVSRFLEDSDESVANVACGAMLRLSDPMLVPDPWGEI